MENTNNLSDQPTFDLNNQSLPLFSISPYNFVGGYKLGEDPCTVQFNFTKKPKWIHRKFMKLCLGFKWIDNK